MLYQLYFCSILTFATALNHEDSGRPSNILKKSDPSPKLNSIEGISQFNVFEKPSRRSYRVDVYFKPPENIYDKTINNYEYTVYEFENTTHLNLRPSKNHTYVPKNTTHFTIDGLQYNKAYYVIMIVHYQGEAVNYAYAGIKHFKYEGNEVSGKFIKSDNYRFAPVFGDAKVIKNPNKSYNISTRWHGIADQDYRHYVKTFVIQITRVDANDYNVAEEIAYNGDIFEHTFTSIPPNAEYQVSIFAIPRSDIQTYVLRDFSSSRQFFDLH